VETALNIERPMQIGQSILLNELLPLQQFVRGELRRLRRRLLNVRLWSGVLDVGSWLVAIVGFTLIVDLLFRLDQAARMILLALGIGLSSWRLYRSLLRPMLHHIDDLRLAQLLDRKHSGMGQQIMNVLQLPDLIAETPQASPLLVHAAVRENARPLQAADWRALVDNRRLHWALVGLVALVVLPITMYVCWPAGCLVWAHRWLFGSNIRWPQRTYLQIEGLQDRNHFLVPRGELLIMHVDAMPTLTRHQDVWQLDGRGQRLVVGGLTSAPTSIVPKQIRVSTTSASGKSRRGNLTQVDARRFRYEFLAVNEPTRFWLKGGDDWLGPVQLIPVDRPQIKALIVHARTPGSIDDEAIHWDDIDSQLAFLSGTRIRIEVQTDQPTESVSFESADQLRGLFQRHDENTFTGAWTLREPMVLEIRLTGAEAQLESKPYFLTIGVQEDLAPRVNMRSTGVGRRITPIAKVPLQLRAVDDFGIQRLSMDLETTVWVDEQPQLDTDHWVVRDASDAQRDSLPLELNRNDAVNLADRNLVPGTALRLRASAEDRSVLGVRTGHSRWLPFEIVSSEELMYEILVKQRAQRGKFETALKMLEEQAAALAAVTEGAQLAPMIRVQKVVARQVWQVAGILDQTLQEMTNNRLGSKKGRELMQQTILQPMRELPEQEFAQLGSVLNDLNQSTTLRVDQIQTASSSLEATVQKMRTILDHMSQWESFVDVLNQLRRVIELQGDELEATKDLRQKETDSLFDE
jgi:hypothetical protein